MVSAGMRRYRVRSAAQAELVGPPGQEPLDLAQLFACPPSSPLPPCRLEIGCGHGEFISAMAAAHPTERFIGVEYDPLRVTKTAHKCLALGAMQVRLFADEAHRFVRLRCPPASMHRIYVLFPDPWPKAAHRRRRLLTRSFLLDLAWIAAPGCRLVVATDAIEYGFHCLSQTTTLPGMWRNAHLPAGYRFDLVSRYPTVFERYTRADGRPVVNLLFERTCEMPPARLPWPAPPDGHAPRSSGNHPDC
jgi:tRNA (guanine-N7-)-methyltransferase